MKKKSLLILSIIMLVSLVVFTGCSKSAEETSQGNLVQNETNNTNGDSKGNFPLTINHGLGEATIKEKPKRIIVFDYGILDALDIMGEDIVGLPKATVPPYLDKYKGDEYTDVGTLKEPNFETIYELNPDLIIISTRQATLYDEFKKIAPTVYLEIDGANYMDTFKANMDILGKIFDKEDLIADEVNKIQNAIEEVKKIGEGKEEKVLFIMANEGNLSAYGPGSRFGIIHNELGLLPADENIDSSTHGQKISFEYILEKDPDYLFVMDRAAVVGGDLSAKNVVENDLVKSTKAYKNGNIVYLDAYIWYVSSGGLTGTMKMIEEVQAALGQ